jgi:serine/threonine protein kinase
MGEVYRARDLRLERPVAIKILTHAPNAEQARARLLAEARAASALNHPHICTIYEVGEIDEQPFIAMELVEGRSLTDTIPREGLSTDAVARYGIQIAEGLHHAHDRGIVHRDLKSANVIITSDGRAKILDFGLATGNVGPADAATRSGAPLARGEIAGTLPYMPPEVLQGGHAGPFQRHLEPRRAALRDGQRRPALSRRNVARHQRQASSTANRRRCRRASRRACDG